jgi:hypothetical protein
MSVVDPATLGPADFVHWCDKPLAGAVGTLHDAPVMLVGPTGTAFNRDDYPGFAAPPFTPPLAATGMVEIQGAPGHSFTLHFPAGIKDPVLHLGSLASALSFTDASSTDASAVTVTRINGDSDDFKVINSSTVSGKLSGSSDSNGTVMIPGVFQRLTFTLTPTFGDSTARDGVLFQIGGTRPV